MLIAELQESQSKAQQLFNEGFDLGTLANISADEYRRHALNYGADLSQTIGAILGMIQSDELILKAGEQE